MSMLGNIKSHLVSSDYHSTSFKSAIFVFLISLSYLIGLLPKVILEETPYIVLLIFTYSLIILTLQFFIILILHRLNTKKSWIALAIPSLLLAINNILLYYWYSDFFQGLSFNGKALFFIGNLSLAFFLVRNFVVSKFFYTITAFLSLLIFATNFDYATIGAQKSINHSQEALAKWNKVKLAQKPNIHLVSLDALIPAKIAKQYMRLDVQYDQEIIKTGGRLLTDTFVARAPSFDSLTSLLALDDRLNFKYDGYLRGEEDSPLLNVMRNNNYKTSIGYLGLYIGPKGIFLDHYDGGIYISTSFISLCKFQSTAVLNFRIGHFGFCGFIDWVQSFSSFSKVSWPDKVLDLATNNPGKDPTFTLHYIYTPIGHTGKDFKTGNEYDLVKYSNYYKINQEKAATYLNSLILKIRDHDPNSLVLIFGDHGAWLSRTISFEENQKFFVQDRYAVFAALLNTQNSCFTADLSQYNKEFKTIGRIMASLIRCLSEKPEYVDEAVNFTQDYDFSSYKYDENDPAN